LTKIKQNNEIKIHFYGTVSLSKNVAKPKLVVSEDGDSLIIKIERTKKAFSWFTYLNENTSLDIYLPNAFSVSPLTNFDFVYFSFTTLTTLGYGDIVPVTDGLQMLTNFEAITGQLFIGVFIGAVTFTGSILAFTKLQGLIGGNPFIYPGRHIVNILIVLDPYFLIRSLAHNIFPKLLLIFISSTLM
jgi:hypothetical protein